MSMLLTLFPKLDLVSCHWEIFFPGDGVAKIRTELVEKMKMSDRPWCGKYFRNPKY